MTPAEGLAAKRFALLVSTVAMQVGLLIGLAASRLFGAPSWTVVVVVGGLLPIPFVLWRFHRAVRAEVDVMKEEKRERSRPVH